MSSAKQYERIATVYDAMDLAEFLFKRHIRHDIFAGLAGQILDVGAGTGCNFPYYPSTAQVIAVDGSPAMLSHAKASIEGARTEILLAAHDVRQLALADDSVDAVVATWLFGVIPDRDQAGALRELARVCRPQGEIRIIDYVPAQAWFRRFLMRAFWAPYQTVVMKCSFNSRPEKHASAAGLRVTGERYIYSDFIRMLTLTPG